MIAYTNKVEATRKLEKGTGSVKLHLPTLDVAGGVVAGRTPPQVGGPRQLATNNSQLACNVTVDLSSLGQMKERKYVGGLLPGDLITWQGTDGMQTDHSSSCRLINTKVM